MSSPGPDDFAAWFHTATGHDPFPYQARLASDPDLPDVLAAPTGAGKTALVLAWLWRLTRAPASVRAATPRRLVYCLPTRVLVEQTYAAICAWLAKLDLLAAQPGDPERVLPVLLMGAQQTDVSWWLYPEQPLAVVGTQEMLLSRALNRGYGASRYRWPQEFGLLHSDALWVLDEVQLMGSGLGTTAQMAAFRRLLGSYGPVHTLWVSATQAARWLATVDHPAPPRALTLTDDDYADLDLGARYRADKPLSAAGVTAADPGPLAGAVLGEHAPGSLSLVVLNRVEPAQQLFRSLSRLVRPGGPEVLLLHSRFRPHERQGWTGWLKSDPPPAGRIIVATQVVEAGVDLDARVLWTELAPWVSLVQRCGRCNRRGRTPDARIFWLEPDKPEPYGQDELDWARQQLGALAGQSASPEALGRVPLPAAVTPGPVLRRRDLLGLFDTSPDLSGNDLDVSRFIRELDDHDVYVYWREWDATVPERELAQPHPRELCPVPIGHLKPFLRKAPAWRFDHLDEHWRQVLPADVRPGQVLLLPARAGGYDPELGWTGAERDGPVPPVPAAPDTDRQSGSRPADAATAADEALAADPETRSAGWDTVAGHTGRAMDALDTLLAALPALGDREREALRIALRWHDAGKGHEVFIRTMAQTAAAHGLTPDPEQTWAKSPFRPGRHGRRHFRHELVSALLYLAQQGWADDAGASLAAYLMAAHHGKVRLAIRSFPDENRPPDPAVRHALGVWEGEALPRPVDLGAGVEAPAGVPLDLEIMELGAGAGGRPSWLQRMLALRDDPELGPFRLAFLEAVLRAADARGSMDTAPAPAPGPGVDPAAGGEPA